MREEACSQESSSHDSGSQEMQPCRDEMELKRNPITPILSKKAVWVEPPHIYEANSTLFTSSHPEVR